MFLRNTCPILHADLHANPQTSREVLADETTPLMIHQVTAQEMVPNDVHSKTREMWFVKGSKKFSPTLGALVFRFRLLIASHRSHELFTLHGKGMFQLICQCGTNTIIHILHIGLDLLSK